MKKYFTVLIITFLLVNSLYLIIESKNRNLYSLDSIIYAAKAVLRPILFPTLEFIGLKEKSDLSLLKKEKRFFVQSLSKNNLDIFYKIEMKEFTTIPKESSYLININKVTPDIENLFVQGSDNQLFHFFDGTNSSKIFTYKEDIAENPLPLLALISSEVVHGNADDGRSFSNNIKSLSRRNLRLTCGSISAFARDILTHFDVKSRIVSTLTLEAWNTYDNGHTLIEVFIPDLDRWILVDLDLKKLFWIDSTNTLASAIDFYFYPFEEIKIIDLVNSTVIDYSREEYNVTNEYLFYLTNDWYKKMFQTVGIIDESTGKTFFPVEKISSNKARRIIEYPNSSFKLMEHEEFSKKFYTE